MAFVSHMATYTGSMERSAHAVTPMLPDTLSAYVIKESEHSRGELLACCHRRAITGLLQNVGNTWRPDSAVSIDSAAMAKSVAVDESLQFEWQRFRSMVAKAVGSRGSRLSVFAIARRSFFMADAVGYLLSRHTVKGLKSALRRVAKLSMIGGNVDGWSAASSSTAQTARVAEVELLDNRKHCDKISENKENKKDTS
jgi:hypothetical protein